MILRRIGSPRSLNCEAIRSARSSGRGEGIAMVRQLYNLAVDSLVKRESEGRGYRTLMLLDATLLPALLVFSLIVALTRPRS